LLSDGALARADQPADAPEPSTPAEPATQAPAEPAPAAPAAAAEPAPAPPAPAPAKPALRPSPGPVADPTPVSYPPLDEVGAYAHEAGFLRVLLGPAGFAAETGHRSLSGGGFDLGLAAGHALRRDLILQLDALFVGATQPTYEVDGEEMDRNITATALNIGPGATYYLPHNVYATGAVYAAWLQRSETRLAPPPADDPFGQPVEEEIDESSKLGIGASATVGKEWWLTVNWGLGVAARLYLATMRDGSSEDTTWGVRSFSILFSATMN
jgi:hypothetical protein